MVMPAYERVGKTLIAVRDGVRPVVEMAWSGLWGDGWIETVNGRDNYPDREPSADDLAFLLKGITNTWHDIWKHQFSHAERSYVSELRDARNRWAHNESFSSDDTYRLLDTAERLLTSFQAVEQVEAVRTLKEDLLRQRYAEQARSVTRKAASAATKGAPAAGLTPWREVVDPHRDVREGRLRQAEFAADLYQVINGRAEPEYQDPEAFFRRTHLTQGLRWMLTNAARRLSGVGGDPVVELQTNFGGGKTHSLISLYHLASGTPPAELPGVGELLAEEGLTMPQGVNRAVFVGQMRPPASPETKPDGTVVNTIWGEIAWQLGGVDGYAMVEAEDRSATNPGDKLVALFERFGPAVVLIDEWVAYARQLPDRGGATLPAGDFDTQFTFAQALTEAAKAVPNVTVLISIPASTIEVGGDRGQEALTRLKHVVSRTASHWQPASNDETFEIVRRRLFDPITPEKARLRDGAVKAYVDYYRAHKGDFPSAAAEAEYQRRMEASYPIHPELFDRLYGDWSTLDRFQRTRGVLRLMAAVVGELWERGDASLLIQPGSIPLDVDAVRSELLTYLDDGWEPVVTSDIDGPTSKPLEMDNTNTNIGRLSATRRVARAVFMGSAPRDEARRGVDIKQIMLGCVQPGESPGVFADALRRLSSEATYLYVDGAQYWYSLQANIIRLANDRAASNFTDDDAEDEVRARLGRESRTPFVGFHVFPMGPGDVPDDDDGVRLVVLPLTKAHITNDNNSLALLAAGQIFEQRQGGPRLYRNLLVFLAADSNRVGELRDGVRQYLAWKSIIEDQKSLNLNEHQRSQAETKFTETDEVVNQRIRETFQLVITPRQEPADPTIHWETVRVTSGESLAERVARRLAAEEKLLAEYSGIRVRMELDRIPLWGPDRHVKLVELWSHYAQRPYLTRLASFDVLARAVEDGVGSLAWEQDTFAYAEAWDGMAYRGLVTGEHVSVRRSNESVVVHPEAVPRDAGVEAPTAEMHWAASAPHVSTDASVHHGVVAGHGAELTVPLPTRFYGRRSLDPVRAVRDLGALLDEIVAHLGPNVELTLEINATSDGYDDRIQRVVKENAAQLGLEATEFEE